MFYFIFQIVHSSFARFFCLRYQSKSVTTIVRSGVQNPLSPANRQLIDLDPSPEFINGGHKDTSALDGTIQHTNNFVDLDTPESVKVRMKDPASDSPSAANLTQHMTQFESWPAAHRDEVGRDVWIGRLHHRSTQLFQGLDLLRHVPRSILFHSLHSHHHRISLVILSKTGIVTRNSDQTESKSVFCARLD